MTARLIVDKKETIVDAPFSAKMLTLARGLPAQYKWEGRTLIARTCRANIDYLKERFTDAELVDVDGSLASIFAVSSIRKFKPGDVDDYAYGTEPFDYQNEAFAVSRARRVFALFLEMGLGKTKILIDTACYLFREGLIDGVLVIAPNGVHRQWAVAQIKLHTPSWVALGGIHWNGEPSGKRTDPDGLQWLCVNVEALSHASGVALCTTFLKKHRALTIIDESIRIKTPGAGRTRAIMKLRPLSEFRRIASGRPITKGSQDLYSQFSFLDPAIVGLDTFTAFKARYCVLDNDRQIIDCKNQEELIQRISPHTFVAEKKNYPAKIYIRRPVPLTKEQRSLYVQFVEEMIGELEDGTIVDAKNALVKLMRLQQVVCGFLPSDDGRIYEIPSNRIRVLQDTLEESGKKTLIWARFQQDIVNIKAALGDSCVVYTGGDDENDAIRRWKNEPDLHLVGNPASGGTGLDLVTDGANDMIYYSNSQNADHRWQSEDRIHRIGVKGDCTYVDLCAPGTIDTKILYSFKKKMELSEAVLKHPGMLEYDEDEPLLDEQLSDDNFSEFVSLMKGE